MELEKYIGITEGFPKEGISFKDVSPLLADGEVFKYTISKMAEIVEKWNPDIIVGPESRGFVFGAPLALYMGKGFVMARKKGKLPGKVISKTYTLEYNTATIELPEFSIKKGVKVCVVDDLLATGGTLKAVEELITEMGGEVVGLLTLIELTDLKGRDLFKKTPYESMIKFPH